jgi:hypothetical protein
MQLKGIMIYTELSEWNLSINSYTIGEFKLYWLLVLAFGGSHGSYLG